MISTDSGELLYFHIPDFHCNSMVWKGVCAEGLASSRRVCDSESTEPVDTGNPAFLRMRISLLYCSSSVSAISKRLTLESVQLYARYSLKLRLWNVSSS